MCSCFVQSSCQKKVKTCSPLVENSDLSFRCELNVIKTFLCGKYSNQIYVYKTIGILLPSKVAGGLLGHILVIGRAAHSPVSW
jgi:hypothetical protein